ncbi:putative adhesin [Lentzea sp. E54]|uniref:putative adhesin n=1 Tax=Lentzea xerophila TaxID=3435883 RepID=UPI003DA4451B
MSGKWFLVGHGTMLAEGPVSVPPGMSVHFYAPPGHSLPFTVVQATLATSGLEGSLWSAPSTGHCPNVLLTAWSAEEIRVARNAVPHGVRAVFVGDSGYSVPANGLPLCGRPQDCAEDMRHSCGGWLDLLGAASELHVLSCLTPLGSAVAPTQWRLANELAVEEEDTLFAFLSAEVDKFARLSPDQREELWESWPDGTRAFMLTDGDMWSWYTARIAREVLASRGEFGLLQHRSTLPPKDRLSLEEHADLTAALLNAELWFDKWDQRIWLPEDAAAVLGALDARDHQELAAVWPELMHTLEAWQAEYPNGLTDDHVQRLAREHNSQVMATISTDCELACAYGPDVVVLAPELLEDLPDDAPHWQLSLSRAISYWPVQDAQLVVRTTSSGMEISGSAARFLHAPGTEPG